MFRVENRLFKTLAAACKYADRIRVQTGVFVAITQEA